MNSFSNAFFRLKKFIRYQFKARTKYYLHSPFVYQFYLRVLEGETDENILSIRSFRQGLRSDRTSVEIQDLGTGKVPARMVCELEKKVAVKEKYGLVLYRLVQYSGPQYILELGTNIGISSIYLAAANPETKILSLEGSDKLAAIARQNHLKFGLENVKIIDGNFDDSLQGVLTQFPFAGLVFFDGNHTRTATLRYFYQCLKKSNESSIFIFDDIYSSPEMWTAWEEVKTQQQVSLTIDLFQLGVCFFIKEKLAREHFVLRY